jgi:polysaccharide export outer membrane protein
MRMNEVLKALALAALLTMPATTFAQSESGAEPAQQKQEAAEQQPQGEKEKSSAAVTAGQDAKDKKKKDAEKKESQTSTSKAEPANSSSASTQQKGSADASSDIPAELQAGRRESVSEEEAAIVPYYNNFLKDYRLGPEDVISIEVFNQPRYSKSNITVPPDGRISFYLIPEGVRVVGKTTQQVQEEIQKKLDEYIIDPQVTVYLDKAMSARYAVLGDVGKPGVMIMTRRVSVLEALAEAGGVLDTGDKKKVAILRRKADGSLYMIPVNISAIEKGQAKEMAYLTPGDQIIVPGNRLKSIQRLLSFTSVLSFGRIFGLPF